MFGQIGAQRVRGQPADVLGDVGLTDGHRLGRQSHAEIEEGGQRQHRWRPAGLSGIDKRANDLRARELQPDAAEKQQREAENPPLQRSEIGRKETRVLDERQINQFSCPRSINFEHRLNGRSGRRSRPRLPL